MVGKYIALTESYKSLNEALTHGGIANDVRVELEYVDAEELDGLDDDALDKMFAGIDGFLIPGGFGTAGSHCSVSVWGCS